MIAPVDMLQRQRAQEMRSNQTAAEAALWQSFKAKRLSGLKFRRQVPMDHYIVDFFCAEHGLVVEVDGPVHDDQSRYDSKRTAWLEAQGFGVLRFSNKQVQTQLPQVLSTIREYCGVKE